MIGQLGERTVLELASANRVAQPARLRSVATWVALAIAVAALATVAVRTGGIEYDDAHYLARGFFHAHQVEARGLAPLRLAWSLMFEAPKPPLYVGWLALGALAMGSDAPHAVLLWGTLAPWCLLLATAGIWAARRGAAAAGVYAMGLLAASTPLVTGAARPLVEVSLAACVALGLWLVDERRLRSSRLLELAAGLAIGLALLVKLTAVLFLALPVLWVILAIRKREGAAAALRAAVLVGAVAALVAGPWYVRNGGAALQFARYAATFAPCVDTGATWTRPFRLLLGTLGWAGIGALGTVLWLGRGAGRKVASGPGVIALLSSITAGVVVSIPPVFEPRYFVPALGPIFVWSAIRVAAWERNTSPTGRTASRLAIVVLAGLGLAGSFRATRAPEPWGFAGFLRQRVEGRSLPLVVCMLGSSPDWNLFRLEAVVERERLHHQVVVDSLLQSGAWNGDDARVKSCDVILALATSGVPVEASQARANTDLAIATRQILGDGRWTPCAACRGQLGTSAPVTVWQRASR